MKSLLVNGTIVSNIRKFIILLFTFSAFNLQAQDRMTPAKIFMNSDLRGYETSLINYFDIDYTDKFACLIRPSFTSEYCLSLCKKTNSLKLKRATKNIWYDQKWYENGRNRKKRNKKVPSKDYRLTISDSLATSLCSMFTSIVLTSTHLENELLGLDGTTYQFIIQPGYIAECWSPRNDTNCGQAVSLIETICKAVENGDSEKAEVLISEVVRITNLFRQYYPEGFKEGYYKEGYY